MKTKRPSKKAPAKAHAARAARAEGAAPSAGTSKFVDLFGVPMDLGGACRGTDMGPSALRIAGLEEKLEQLGFDVTDRGDLHVDSRETSKVGDARARYARVIAGCC